MAGLITFMNGAAGRNQRIVLGLALIWLGLLGPMAGSTGGMVVAIIGSMTTQTLSPPSSSPT